MTGNPRVSIVIPVFNGADYLREAIDSALAQTWPNREVLVVNDGSTDGGETERIARSFGGRIRYIAKENGGVASALNRGIREMEGEFFSWLSHDDVYFPDKLERQIRYLKDRPSETIVYGDYDFIDAASKVIGRYRIKPPAPEDFAKALLLGHPINGCTALVPKACFDQAGLFDVNLRTTQDYDLWFRFAQRFSFEHLPGAVLLSRLHPEQGSRTIKSHQEEKSEFFIQSIKKLEKVRSDEKTTLFFIRQLAVNLRLRGYVDAAEMARQVAWKNEESSGNLKEILWSVRYHAAFPIVGKIKRKLIGS